ncbi:MAG TPA: hypothetical protein DHW02_06275 [Ktedonobacter sp.]|nr:hypothetical protein [Ktedonobacter sp.]
MSPNSCFSPQHQPHVCQPCIVHSWHDRCIPSRLYIFLLGCLLVLLTACSASPTSPSSNATRTSSPTGNQPISSPTSTVAPGTVLYQADWSHGLDGWKGSSGWSAVQGNLQGVISANGSSITAPYIPHGTNYTIEATIQVVRLFNKNGGYYSIFASPLPGKDGFQAGVSDLKGPGPRPNGSNAQLQIFIDPMAHMAPGAFQPSDNDPKTLWHTYRIDVQGNEAVLSVDGNEVHSASSIQTDTLSNGPLGISCGMVVLRVSSFRILAL